MTDLLDHLRTAVGADHVLTDDTDVAAYVVDWTGVHAGRALAVVRPGSTDEVAAVVTACHGAGVAIVPQGGNTGLVGGGVPDGSGDQVVLSLGRMRTVRIRPRDSTTWSPEPSGTPPPTSPVLPPCGTVATPASWHAVTTAATSSVDPGRTTASARPAWTPVQSTTYAPVSSSSVRTWSAPTAVRRWSSRSVTGSPSSRP